MYWEGEIQMDGEVQLLMKTTADRLERLQQVLGGVAQLRHPGMVVLAGDVFAGLWTLGDWGFSAQMGADQVLKRHLRTRSQLRHDLPCTNGAELAAALEGLPLGVAVQESARIEVSGTGGVDEVSEDPQFQCSSVGHRS